MAIILHFFSFRVDDRFSLSKYYFFQAFWFSTRSEQTSGDSKYGFLMASAMAVNPEAVIVPLLSIPFQPPLRPKRRSGRRSLKKNANAAKADVDSVIPSLMSLALDPPVPAVSNSPAGPAKGPFCLPIVKQKQKQAAVAASGLVGGQVQPLLLMTENMARSTVDGLVPLLRRGITPHDRLEIVEVERTNKTRREFAQIARDVTRECFEPPAGSRILFAYYTFPSGKRVRPTFLNLHYYYLFFIFYLLRSFPAH